MLEDVFLVVPVESSRTAKPWNGTREERPERMKIGEVWPELAPVSNDV